MNTLKNILNSTAHLFYPHTCTGCGSDLLDEHNMLCLQCINSLPHTQYAKHAGNPIEKIFWGRLPIKEAYSEFYFAKETLVQHLIHQLKYKNNQQIGIYLGELMGNTLLKSNRFSKIDILVPLPLFADKERKRGYNQSMLICDGISKITKIPISTGNVIRQRFTETQTKKQRTERWQNVDGSFAINNSTVLVGKNILLVDDVITTGATLEACGKSILQIENTSLYIAALAYAVN